MVDALVVALDSVAKLLRDYGFTDSAKEYEVRARELAKGCSPEQRSKLSSEIRTSLSGMGGLVDRELRTETRIFGEPGRFYDEARDRLTVAAVADNARLQKLADEIFALTRAQ